MEHAAGYGALVHEEVAEAGSQLVKRAAAWAAAGIFGLLFAIFAGTAVMLGFVHGTFQWALVLVPGITLVMAIGAFVYARSPVPSDRFAGLRTQLQADIRAFKNAGEQA